MCLNKRLIKQSRRRWFEIPSRSLWRHCNDNQAYWPGVLIWRRCPHNGHSVRGQSTLTMASSRSFDNFMVVSLNNLLNKQSDRRWFESYDAQVTSGTISAIIITPMVLKVTAKFIGISTCLLQRSTSFFITLMVIKNFFETHMCTCNVIDQQVYHFTISVDI